MFENGIDWCSGHFDIRMRFGCSLASAVCWQSCWHNLAVCRWCCSLCLLSSSFSALPLLDDDSQPRGSTLVARDHKESTDTPSQRSRRVFLSFLHVTPPATINCHTYQTTLRHPLIVHIDHRPPIPSTAISEILFYTAHPIVRHPHMLCVLVVSSGRVM